LIIIVAVILGLLAPLQQTEAKAFKIVRTGIFVLSTDLLMRAMAKELCSCWHVDRVGEGGPFMDGVELCLERSQLPITPGLINILTEITVSDDTLVFDVDVTMLGALASLFRGDEAMATFNKAEPQFGCTLNLR
jgi:hypothetical protein